MMKSPSQLVREHIATQGSDPVTDTSSGICTTVELASGGSDAFWIQLHQGVINFQHQDSPEKDEILGNIIDAFPVPDTADLDPGVYMTFELGGFSSEQLDQFIDRLVREYFGATSSETVSCRSELL